MESHGACLETRYLLLQPSSHSHHGYHRSSFVTAVKILPGASGKYLLSGAGDATVRVWEFLKGLEIQTFDIRETLGMPPADPEAEEDLTVLSIAVHEGNNHIAVALEK